MEFDKPQDQNKDKLTRLSLVQVGGQRLKAIFWFPITRIAGHKNTIVVDKTSSSIEPQTINAKRNPFFICLEQSSIIKDCTLTFPSAVASSYLKMANHATPSPILDANRNRLPTLFEVLSRRTAPPVDLFSFYIYMRDQQRSVDYLDFWYVSQLNILAVCDADVEQARCCATHVPLQTLCSRTSTISHDWYPGGR